ncbi:inactive serine/threonine-protein kinase 19-like [Ornithodoros turicata]|uniref:inactive serine/threonine-protein kinase 19-like n=1 Tax=Ornithodoros turicata TaxID=34597 RepID=UPI00313952D5
MRVTMSQKRPLAATYRQKKKICVSSGEKLRRRTIKNGSSGKNRGAGCEAQTAFQMLCSLFPKEKFPPGFPPVVMKHQLYAIIPSRTDADRMLNAMQEQGEVRLFKLGPQETDIAVTSKADFFAYVRQDSKSTTVEDFLTRVLSTTTQMSFSKEYLVQEQGFQEAQISELVQHGLLALRDIGRWWLGLPGVGAFVKILLHGRKTLLQTLRRCKYRELLRSDLESRKLPRSAKLGMSYHIYDAIGADLITCVKTTSGDLLRIRE